MKIINKNSEINHESIFVRNKNSEINYESIIAGLLLKFESIDNVDFSLLIEDFKNKTGFDIWGICNRMGMDIISRYVKFEINGSVSLKEGLSLDSIIEKENKTIREKLLEVASNEVVMGFINGIDVEKHYKNKYNAVFNNKVRVKNGANILLISDIQDDYDRLVNYGFKNVEWFKSIIRADAYFAKNPEALEKYHIILKGNQIVQPFSSLDHIGLDERINELSNKKNVLVTSLNRYDYPDHTKFVTHLDDYANSRSWDVETHSYEKIFDKIIENILINHTLDNVDLKNTKFSPIQDKINPNRLALPRKKSDLKILYLGFPSVSDYSNEITRTLGLNITFKEDNNYSLVKEVRSHLGEYDIIIVSQIYSGNILRYNHESTEQCKDTGRELTLFVTYDDLHWGVDDNFGDGVRLAYSFGGNLAPDYNYHSKDIRILKLPISIEGEEDWQMKYTRSERSKMNGSIQAAVNFYNEALIQMGKSPISDLDLKTADELDNEYEAVVEYERKRMEAELAPIRKFDSIRCSIANYLNYRNNGLIKEDLERLIITEGKEGIKVENVFQGRKLCAVVLRKEYMQHNMRIFEIQTLSKKGVLSEPQTVGIYTSECESLKDLPPKPDEKQVNALLSIEKKINVILNPLNEDDLQKQISQNSRKKRYLKNRRTR